MRCALGDGQARPEDLLDYVRAPGLLARPEIADRLEARIRREGVRTVARARLCLRQVLAPQDAAAAPLDPAGELDALAAAADPAGALCALAR